ncbi:MAG: hypothetical protein LIP28_08455, partial [Deltaproteobacteria bacterium]|nr:hypothetical protein [Deltaproteobacteria bacterium]
MRKLLSQANRFFSMLCGWLMLLLMILLVWDFMGRGLPGTVAQMGEFLNSAYLKELSEAAWLHPSSILADLSVFIMIAGVYLGLALCE